MNPEPDAALERVIAEPEAAPERLAGFGAALAFGFVAAIAGAYAFAWLAVQVAARETVMIDDAWFAAVLQVRSPALDAVARALSFLGNEALWLIGGLLVVVLARQRRYGTVALLLLTGLGAQLLNNTLKLVFQRARPEAIGLVPTSTFSFPSGHAMVAIACYLLVVYLTWHVIRGWRRWLLASGLVVLILLIGASRVYLGVHYVTDVLAGFVAGVVWLDAVLIGAHALKTRRRRRLS